MRPGLWLQSRKQVSIFTMEASRITKGQKSTTSLQQCESNADLFLRFHVIVHHEYAPEGQTTNKEYYLEVLHYLHDAVQRKWPDMWTGKNWQLHHDNAPAHSAHVIKSFLAKNNTALVQQLPYSPDLAPCDFWLFPKFVIVVV